MKAKIYFSYYKLTNDHHKNTCNIILYPIKYICGKTTNTYVEILIVTILTVISQKLYASKASYVELVFSLRVRNLRLKIIHSGIHKISLMKMHIKMKNGGFIWGY